MSDPFLAEIRMWPFSLTPKGWAACNGQYLYIHQYTRLYSLLGDSFGSGGPTRFRLPLFDAKAPMHWGAGPGLTARHYANYYGNSMVALTEKQMPSHKHVLTAPYIGKPTTSEPQNYYSPVQLAEGDVPIKAYCKSPDNLCAMSSQSISKNGSSYGHNNMQPLMALQFCIALTGVYPPKS